MTVDDRKRVTELLNVPGGGGGNAVLQLRLNSVPCRQKYLFKLNVWKFLQNASTIFPLAADFAQTVTFRENNTAGMILKRLVRVARLPCLRYGNFARVI